MDLPVQVGAAGRVLVGAAEHVGQVAAGGGDPLDLLVEGADAGAYGVLPVAARRAVGKDIRDGIERHHRHGPAYVDERDPAQFVPPVHPA
ncbi:hypothetical protein RM590_33860 [Streptomyces sp. DSM 44938]|uniref:Uncharacterized protein n=1 Tax=Streptomyces litchfieldiae TaxID=3075543 RepID=A0ABU2N1P0_9ACTN|nr:hypothetical protein [Streptomyces sp. DSM 44938]MDT0347517.1 hypothetical protein [Streptomyces sp. DSM 44938]